MAPHAASPLARLPDVEHHADIGAFLVRQYGRPSASCGFSTGDIAAFVVEREGGGLCGLVEASIRPFDERVEAKPVDPHPESMTDASFVSEILGVGEEFKQDRLPTSVVKRLGREGLELICFDYILG